MAIVPFAARDPRVAVLIPCYNEAATIAGVVQRFRRALPTATIYVFDNGSTDATGAAARDAGATVVDEPRRGKGHVVQAMFRQVDADAYVMVDGDGTYPAEMVEALLAPVARGEADMVIGSRLHRSSHSQFHPLHRLGNALFRATLRHLFDARLSDLLSGYRAFSRPLVQALPLVGGGFETEAEMTIRALEAGFRIVEVPVDLVARPRGSHSKIRVVRDGLLILGTMLALARRRVLPGLVVLGLVLLTLAATGAWRGHLPLGVALAVIGAAILVLALSLAGVIRRFRARAARPSGSP